MLLSTNLKLQSSGEEELVQEEEMIRLCLTLTSTLTPRVREIHSKPSVKDHSLSRGHVACVFPQMPTSSSVQWGHFSVSHPSKIPLFAHKKDPDLSMVKIL